MSDNLFDEASQYRKKPGALLRLKYRWKRIIEPITPHLRNASVLDLGAHDGRWAYACIHAGANHAVAVEARPAAIQNFAHFPNENFKENVTLVESDLYEFLEKSVARGDKFDVVLLLGVLYHTIDHFRLFLLIRQLEPNLIVIDSEFINSKNPIIQMVVEKTDKVLNAVSQYEGQVETLVGIPSVGGIEKIADILDYRLYWYQDDSLDTAPSDYSRDLRKSRHTCYLYP